MANILCIDIGGTRIKAANLCDNIDIQKLKNAKVQTIRTLGWLNSSLPQILNIDYKTSLIHPNKKMGKFDMISAGVPMEVDNNGINVSGYYVEKQGIPPKLLREFEINSKCKVKIMNDSEAWIKGILNYFRIFSKKVELPCLCIILGTGVGVVFYDLKNKIERILLSKQNSKFPYLSKVSNIKINTGGKIHSVIGNDFFSKVKKQHTTWTYHKIENEYTTRIIAFIKDVEKKNLLHFKNVKTIFIGGGNANYLNDELIEKSIPKSIYIFKKDNLEISPDLIPLLGHVKID